MINKLFFCFLGEELAAMQHQNFTPNETPNFKLLLTVVLLQILATILYSKDSNNTQLKILYERNKDTNDNSEKITLHKKHEGVLNLNYSVLLPRVSYLMHGIYGNKLFSYTSTLFYQKQPEMKGIQNLPVS